MNDKKNLLLVTNNADLEKSIKELLEKEYTIKIINNAKNINILSATTKTELCFFDCTNDDFALLEHYTNECSQDNISIIAIINADNSSANKAIVAGADDYISLPIEKELLNHRINSIIKKIEYHFETELLYNNVDDKKPISTSIINLTKNTVENIYIDGFVFDKDGYTNLTNYRDRASLFFDKIVLSDTENEKLSPSSLLKQYSYGTHTCFLEYPAVSKKSNHEVWVHVNCRMFTRKHTGDVIAIFSNQDYTKNYLTENLIKTVARSNYDFAGILFEDSGNSFILDYTGKYVEGKVYSFSFNENFKKYINKFKLPNANSEQINEIISNNKIKNIVKQLSVKDVYRCQFGVQERENGNRMKEVSYAYADKDRGVICYVRSDITDLLKKELDKQTILENALEAAEKANLAKTEFLATVSHEIRTPLNVIIGMSTLAHDDINNAQVINDYLNKIDVSSNHLLNLINNILDMSKIENAEFELHPEEYNYQEFKKYIDSIIIPMCREKNINFVEKATNNHITILADKLRLNQVIFNILSNAVKFTPEGGNIYFTYKNIIKDDVCEVVFEIKDTGIGMSDEFQKRLFTPFTQENNGVMAAVQGTGLGLSLSKGIVDKMGGNIKCNSIRGEGTTFTIQCKFPISNTNHKINDSEKAEFDFGGKTILIVEDHPLNKMIIEKLLLSKNANIMSCENGKKALETFTNSKENAIDAILMDIRMPEMDGIETTKRIRSTNRTDTLTIPIIAMTANAYDSDRKEALDAGMNYHLSKPIQPYKLFSVLDEFINKKSTLTHTQVVVPKIPQTPKKDKDIKTVELVQLAQKHYAENEQLEKIINQSQQAIIVSDINTHNILFANNKAFQLFEVTDNNYKGKKCYKTFLKLHTPCTICNLATTQKLGETHEQFQINNKQIYCRAIISEWNGKNAVIEYFTDITPYTGTNNNSYNDIKNVLTAFRLTGTFCIFVNLTKNEYHIIEDEKFVVKKAPQSGSYDEFFDAGIYTIHQDERETFIETFSREPLLRAYNNGKRFIHLNHKQIGKDGFWHRISTNVIFLNPDVQGNICYVTISFSLDNQN